MHLADLPLGLLSLSSGYLELHATLVFDLLDPFSVVSFSFRLFPRKLFLETVCDQPVFCLLF